MRYILRLQMRLFERWDVIAPSGKKSAFLEEALKTFLALPPQVLPDRPRFADNRSYSKICVNVPDRLAEKAKKKYPDASFAVLLQAAVAHSLDSAKYLENPRFIKQNMPERIPMRTRMQPSKIAHLKQIGADPLYGTMRKVITTAIEQFFEIRPWEGAPNFWKPPGDRDARGWEPFNVVLMPDAQDSVRKLAQEIDVSIVTILHSALVWWLSIYGQHRK